MGVGPPTPRERELGRVSGTVSLYLVTTCRAEGQVSFRNGRDSLDFSFPFLFSYFFILFRCHEDKTSERIMLSFINSITGSEIKKKNLSVSFR